MVSSVEIVSLAPFIVIEAQHFCMMMRGVQKKNSCTITSMMLGAFRDNDRIRQAFLQLISKAN